MTNVVASLAECVLWEISGTSIGTKPKGIQATYVISGDRDDPV